MTVFDCFVFSDELDMLEFRLNELDDVVDKFVLVEAPITFQGHQKLLHYRHNRDRFARWQDRIVHVEAKLPADADPWQRENLQREHIMVGLCNVGARNTDMIVLSDVDEVWRPEVLRRPDPFIVFDQTMYVWNLGWRSPSTWPGTVACYLSTLRGLPRDPFTTMRCARLHKRPEHVSDGGWHFSWFGGTAAARAKRDSFAHTELSSEVKDRIGDGRYARDGIHVDGTVLERVEIDYTYPRWVRAGHAPKAWLP